MKLTKKISRIWNRLLKNDVLLKIYISFAAVLSLMGVVTGMIFLQLYQQNYIRSYTELLTRQGKIISKRVARFQQERKPELFQKYQVYIDELERAERTDIWIVANPEADFPLGQDYVNADAVEEFLEEDTYQVLRKAFQGKKASKASYDRVYGMTTLSVASPISNKKTEEVIGAVMLVCMIDRQTMGLDEGRYLITLSVFLAIVISYIVALAFSRYLSRPLNKIGKNIGRLANGDYTEIEVKRPKSQIGVLEGALNHLSGELRKASEEREALEQVRRDFFANVSHELRTPITVLRGYSETLSDGVVTDEGQVQEMYQRILQECRGMERLVEDLFILSKMQNPDFHLELEPVSLVQVFEDVLRGGKMISREKGIVFHTRFPQDDICLILGDYGRLRQMFMIIVDNAVKFSREQGEIAIRISKEKGRYQIAIQDYGVGIAEEQLPFIFEKFYTSKMRQNEKGTGLGLMIAKQIALRHGGDIRVESVSGGGTTFYFDFEECTDVEGYL